MTDWLKPQRPYAIAHRGARAYAPGNTLRAFAVANELGADMWEIDIRRSGDGKIVVHHDAVLADGEIVAEIDYDTLLSLTTEAGAPAPLLDAVLDLALEADAGIYADIKDIDAVLPTFEALKSRGIERAVLGAFDPEAARMLADAGCTYPRAALVPLGADPFEHAKGADIVHLCWERMDRPQDTLTDELFAQADANGQHVVIWHEEDPERMAAIRQRPVLGICSDTPELVHPFVAPADWPVQVVCHRGANLIAPENTLAAARCAFMAGFDIVEIDVRETADGDIVVMHDRTLDRTTTSRGLVTARTRAELDALDAGSRFHAHFAGEKVPGFDETLALARRCGKGLYVEIKDAPAATVLAQVEAADMLGSCFFWSFSTAGLKALRALSADARIMARYEDFISIEEALDFLDPALIQFDWGSDLSGFEAVRAAGKQAMICYMGQDAAVMDGIIAARPDLVNLDQPFLFRRRMAAAGLPITAPAPEPGATVTEAPVLEAGTA